MLVKIKLTHGRFTRGSQAVSLEIPRNLASMSFKKSVKWKIRYHVESLPAADNGFPDHDHPPDSGFPDSSFPDSVKIYKNNFHYFWSGPPRGAQGKPNKSKKMRFVFGQKFLVMSKIVGHFDSLISMI